MKVFLVEHCYHYESSTIEGVFSTYEKAAHYCDLRADFKRTPSGQWTPVREYAAQDLTIIEFEVDENENP